MKTEKAIYAPNIKQIPKIGGFARVYFGAEFCQWRMPAASTVVRAFERASESGLGFTLVTPWVTDKGLSRLETALGALAEVSKSASKTEVVVNDYGVLLLLSQMRSGLVPVLGRLLTRQKRCPRVPGLIAGLPDEGRGLYMGAGLEDPLTAKYLKGFGVKRVELDNPLQGIDVDLRSAGLKGTLYTPYAYVTVTRHCPGSFDGSTWKSFTGCREMACLQSSMEMRNPAHEAPLIMKGNAQFVNNPVLPGNLGEMGIDRVVHMEALP